MRRLVLLALWLISSAAIADPTRPHLRELHRDLDELTARLERLAGATHEADDCSVSRHLGRMEAHLQRVRSELCGQCGAEDLPPSSARTAQARCAGSQMHTSLAVQDYASLMRRETHWMHDRLLRMTTEKSMFERQRLLRQYYDRVLRTIDATQPVCKAGQQRPATHSCVRHETETTPVARVGTPQPKMARRIALVHSS